MSDIDIQASFNSGEWSPNLYARVDIQQYKSGAALLENWYVDYRGGASTRPGTAYILQAYKSDTAVRLINFQASFNVGYVLEFGDHYLRFYYRGSPVLEDQLSITGASKANPAVVQVTGNTYVPGDWIFVRDIGGMTQLNGRYYKVHAVAGTAVTLYDLQDQPVNSVGYGTYTSGGKASRIYTIASPYAAEDLSLLKFTQNVSEMILCHPLYPVYVLQLISALSWNLTQAVIGSTAPPPVVYPAASSLGPGPVNYAYVVTSIDQNGQESAVSNRSILFNFQDIRTVSGTNYIQWDPLSGVAGYNVYEASPSYLGSTPDGAQFGFIGTTRGTAFVDSNIAPDFTQTPPIPRSPFTGYGVSAITITNPGSYTSVPSVTLVGGSPTITASASVTLGVLDTPTVASNGTGFLVGDTVTFPNNVLLRVTSVSGGGVTGFEVANRGVLTAGSVPANPVAMIATSGGGSGTVANFVWGVTHLTVLNPGSGYASAPTVTFSAGTAAAYTTIAGQSNGNPTVPGFFQQRLVLAAPTGAPQTFYMSRPGTNYNFDVSSPSQPDDSITGTLVSGVLNTIKAMVSAASGLLILTDRAAWLVNGGSPGSAVSPSSIVANAQSFVGISDVPPLVMNSDILYVQSKGAAVRDLAFNIYSSVFESVDISVISSHLFYSYEITEWAWAEQPFYVVWAVRDDGVMLTLTFLKDQQFKGWSHQVTQGKFKSVTSVTELTTTAGNVDAIYTVVEREVNGKTLKYIERVAERSFPDGVVDAWCVDAGIQYVGEPVSAFTGGEHLAGLTVTGLADGVPITPFVMPASGQFTLPNPASKVTVGLGYTCDLMPLPLQLDGEAVQAKLKKTPHVDVRVNDALGLMIGSDFDHLTPMKDLVPGNVSSMRSGLANQRVTDLVFGDARTFLDPTYTVPGQFAIRQALPYPATILGLFPSYVIGDDKPNVR